MMLVYSPKVTNRLRYILDLLLGELLGLSFELTHDTDAFLNFKGPLINYSMKPMREEELHVVPSRLLELRGVQHLVPEVKTIERLPCLFPSKKAGNPLGFDPFSAAFYLVSRYEEYLPFKKDAYGRFEASQSFAFQHGFLEVPVVNHYALRIRQELLLRFPFMEFPVRKFSFLPTYDVDVAFAYRGRGALRTLGGTLRELFQGKFQTAKLRWMVLMGKSKDPFDTYDYQLELHKKHQLKAFYFFLCGDYGPFDKNVSFFSGVFQKLVKKIGDYAFTGIHPSFLAHDDPQRLAGEVRRMSNITNREILFSRQHYLRLRFPQTYRNLQENEITHDFTMGYASQPGFRAGICSPFYFYDLELEAVSALKIFPFTVMDGTLKDYLRLQPEEATQTINRLIRAVKSVEGHFISLWHNESLCECGRWKGWRFVYENMVSQASALQKDKG
ncbi:MAG: polysaccharide deacetylase family protein [Bacteroidales bacterium]